MPDGFKLALSFLTVVPVKLNKDVDSGTFGKSIAYFPVVGLLIGIVLAALWYLFVFKIGLGKSAASIIVVIALAALTRMLHLDGLADMFDGLFGGKDSDHSLAIMKDSRVGSFGVVSVSCALLAKYAFLSALDGPSSTMAIILFPVAGRFMASFAMITQPYARNGGLAMLFSEGRKTTELIVPTIFTVILAFALLGISGIVAVIVTGFLAVIILRWNKGKIGGITGDIIGGLIEISEIILLLVVIVGGRMLGVV
jgi:adenosylcobinamide-GDP ribazoletransferase